MFSISKPSIFFIRYLCFYFKTRSLQNSFKVRIKLNYFSNGTFIKIIFFNPAIQENIRTSKEEQYQGEFLIDLFVKVLDYAKNPTTNFTLTTEYKNMKDSKQADEAILISW